MFLYCNIVRLNCDVQSRDCSFTGENNEAIDFVLHFVCFFWHKKCHRPKLNNYGRKRSISNLPVANTFAKGISGNEVVGWFGDSGNNPLGSFVYTGARPTFQNPNPWFLIDASTQISGNITATFANGIDGSNIVGYYTVNNKSNYGYLYDGTNYTTIDASGLTTGVAQTFANRRNINFKRHRKLRRWHLCKSRHTNCGFCFGASRWVWLNSWLGRGYDV